MTGNCFFQNFKIQRSVARAREGTTFPVSLKLKVNFPSEKASLVQGDPVPVLESENAEDHTATFSMECSFAATVWVFTTISGLITVQADGTIYGINNAFSLMLFGYEKRELLGKVKCYFFSLSTHLHETVQCFFFICLNGSFMF